MLRVNLKDYSFEFYNKTKENTSGVRQVVLLGDVER